MKTFRQEYKSARFWFWKCIILTPVAILFSDVRVQFGDKMYYVGYPFVVLALFTSIGIFVFYDDMKKAKRYIVFDDFLNQNHQ